MSIVPSMLTRPGQGCGLPWDDIPTDKPFRNTEPVQNTAGHYCSWHLAEHPLLLKSVLYAGRYLEGPRDSTQQMPVTPLRCDNHRPCQDSVEEHNALHEYHTPKKPHSVQANHFDQVQTHFPFIFIYLSICLFIYLFTHFWIFLLERP